MYPFRLATKPVLRQDSQDQRRGPKSKFQNFSLELLAKNFEAMRCVTKCQTRREHTTYIVLGMMRSATILGPNFAYEYFRDWLDQQSDRVRRGKILIAGISDPSALDRLKEDGCVEVTSLDMFHRQ
jgi:hypothetical protein